MRGVRAERRARGTFERDDDGFIRLLERVVTVWRGGWRARILAASLFPELVYDMYLSAVFVVGLVNITLGRKARWGHVQRDAVAAGEGPREA